MSVRLSLVLIGGTFLLSACTQTNTEDTPTAQIAVNAAPESQIISESDIAVENAPWGDFLAYYTDDTHALKPVLVGVARIDAGQQIHPPHRHADEEYLMVTKGQGIWTLNGVDSPAVAGDILFARAWDYHGVRAANNSPLEFVVFKYSGRGVEMPTDPNPELPAESKE